MRSPIEGGIFGAGVVLALLTIGQARANLISNGDFATGDFTDWTIADYGSGGGSGDGGPSGSGFPAVTSFDVTGGGAQNAATFLAELTSGTPGDGASGGASLSQTFTSAAGPVDFSAAIAAAVDHFNADFGTFTVLIDGAVIDTFAFGGQEAGTYRDSLSAADVLSAGTHDLEIDISRTFMSGGPGNTPLQYITDIDLEQAAAPSTPEPGSLALLASGLLALSRLRPRQRLSRARLC